MSAYLSFANREQNLEEIAGVGAHHCSCEITFWSSALVLKSAVAFSLVKRKLSVQHK